MTTPSECACGGLGDSAANARHYRRHGGSRQPIATYAPRTSAGVTECRRSPRARDDRNGAFEWCRRALPAPFRGSSIADAARAALSMPTPSHRWSSASRRPHAAAPAPRRSRSHLRSGAGAATSSGATRIGWSRKSPAVSCASISACASCSSSRSPSAALRSHCSRAPAG